MRKIFRSWTMGSFRNFTSLPYKKYEELFKDNNLKKVLFFALMTALLAIVVVLAIDLYFYFSPDDNSITPGEFGDFFGGTLNPIFTFLTFLGLIVTIVLQQNELRLARTEFEKTSDALRTQAIETTFFNILDLHHNIIDNLRVDIREITSGDRNPLPTSLIVKKVTHQDGTVTKDTIKSPKDDTEERLPVDFSKFDNENIFKGREVFSVIIHYISQKNISKKNKAPDIVRNYRKIQVLYNDVLGHYFRNLYQALKLIDKYDEDFLTLEKKKKYASILRSQLSTKELALLFINCLDGVSDNGEFKNLLIEYAMLEHLPIEANDIPPQNFKIRGLPLRLPIDTLLQYHIKKEIQPKATSYFGGAFGKNTGIPANLIERLL